MVYWHILVTIGQWAQTHHELVLAISVIVVLVLGAARVPWRSALHGRRPRR
jgi:hypothetical protein